MSWERVCGSAEFFSSESMMVNLQLIGHWAVRYSITSPARQHISKALSLFEDNKLIPRQINAFHLYIPVEVLTQGACLNYCDSELFNAFQRGIGSLERFSLSQRTHASWSLQDSLTVVVEDLRLCSVKPCEDIERRFCFEVVSPTKWVLDQFLFSEA